MNAMSDIQVLLDLDGVLVDFTKGALDFHGVEIPYRELRWDFDKGIPNFWEPLGYEFWAALPWTVQGRELLSHLESIVSPKNICICTSPPHTSGSIEGKVAWVKDNIPQYRRNFMVTPVKHFASGPLRILIDDNDKNCRLFEESGGIAIKVPAPWNDRCNELDENDRYSVQAVLRPIAEMMGALVCDFCSYQHEGDCNPYGTGSLVPSDHWGRGCNDDCPEKEIHTK